MDIMDWNNSTLAKDEFSLYSSSDTVSINTGSNTKDFTALHTFDTNDDYDGSNGNAAITGTINFSNLASDTYGIYVDCSTDDYSYNLNYDFMNFQSGDTLTYKFTNLDPTKEHNLSFIISTEGSSEYAFGSEPEVTVPANNLSDGSTTTVNFTLPAP